IALVDFYFILTVGWLMFDLPQPASQLLLFLLAFVYVAAMIALGLLISLVSKTQQQAMFLAIFIIVPSILLSGFIFPLEAIDHTVRAICYFIPFTYFVEIVRGLLVKQTHFSDLIPAFSALIGFMIAFVGISIIKFKKSLS
ncbi:MAG: ABC transporter permease, partial [Calditrichaeota bacterium]|nr:ABC transporter permease [Calditrichota bacterium]